MVFLPYALLSMTVLPVLANSRTVAPAPIATANRVSVILDAAPTDMEYPPPVIFALPMAIAESL